MFFLNFCCVWKVWRQVWKHLDTAKFREHFGMFGNKPVIPVPRGKSSGKTTVVETCLTSAVQLSLFRRLFLFFFNVYSVYIYISIVFHQLCWKYFRFTELPPSTGSAENPQHIIWRFCGYYWKMRNRKACFYSNCLMVCTFSCATPQKKQKKKKSKQHLQPNCSPDISHSHPFWSKLWCLNQPPGLH